MVVMARVLDFNANRPREPRSPEAAPVSPFGAQRTQPMSLAQVAHRRRMLRFLLASRDAHGAPREMAR